MNKETLFYAFNVNLKSARIKKELSLLQSLLLFTIALLPYLERDKKDFDLKIFTYDLWFMDKDIMEMVKSWSLNGINMLENGMIDVDESNYKNIDTEYQRFGNKMIMWLANNNKDLINYSASQVVDLMHKWKPYGVTKRMWVWNVGTDLLISCKFYYYL